MMDESPETPADNALLVHKAAGKGDAPAVPSVAPSSRGIVLAASISAMTAATLGYDVGVMADAVEYIEDGFDLNSSTVQLLVGSLNFVAAFGTLVAGSTADWLGRKPTVQLCCTLYIVGTALMALAPQYWLLLLGRIITGVGVGVSFVVTPVYIAEITPSTLRGKLGVCFDIAVNAGIVLGYLVGFIVSVTPGMGKSERWRLMLGLGVVLPIIVTVFLATLPESPRYLMKNGKEEQAKTVLTNFLGDEDVATDTIEEIREAIEQEGAWRPLSWGQFLFPPDRYSKNVRNLALGMGFWQQATGSEAVLYYSGTFLKDAGLESNLTRLLGFIGIGMCKLVPEALVMLQIEELGRRPFVVGSSVGITVTIALLAVIFVVELPPALVVVLLCCFMGAFSAGVGPVTWVTVSECTPLRQRAKGMTLCSFVNRLMSGAVALSTLSTCQALGYSGFFLLYASVSTVATLYYYTSVPETKGKTLEQITADLKLAAGETHDLLNGPLDGPTNGAPEGFGTSLHNPLRTGSGRSATPPGSPRTSRASRHSMGGDVGRGAGRVSF